MDFFTEGLYTNLKDNSTEFYEDEIFVSYKTSLDSPDAVKRSLDLEQFGNTRFRVPKFTEETGAGKLNIAVRVCEWRVCECGDDVFL